MVLVIEIALGVFLGLAAWRFRWPLVIVGMTRDIACKGASSPTRRCPINATITGVKQATGAEAKPRGKIEYLWVAGRRAQARRCAGTRLAGRTPMATMLRRHQWSVAGLPHYRR